MPDVLHSDLHLPEGLDARKTYEFGLLIADIAGDTLGPALPYLAPALLFSSPAAQARIGVLQPGDDEVLLHDYQAIRYDAPLPCNRALEIGLTQNGTKTGGDYAISVSCDGIGALRLDTALRVVLRRDLLGLKPTQFRAPESLATLGLRPGLSVTQAQVDLYLALSGDSNPIHSDAPMAEALGLAAPIVPGMLLVSTIQPACHSALPNAQLISLKARFMAPLCVGAPYQIALQDRGKSDAGIRLRAYLMTDSAQALAVADLVFQAT